MVHIAVTTTKEEVLDAVRSYPLITHITVVRKLLQARRFGKLCGRLKGMHVELSIVVMKWLSYAIGQKTEVCVDKIINENGWQSKRVKLESRAQVEALDACVLHVMADVSRMSPYAGLDGASLRDSPCNRSERP